MIRNDYGIKNAIETFMDWTSDRSTVMITNSHVSQQAV